jgi:hypothetical protein
MAENAKCTECGRVLEMFSGLTIDDATYHARCWEQTRMARSTVSAYDQTRSGPIKRGLERRKL